jgi:hypothetical protein
MVWEPTKVFPPLLELWEELLGLNFYLEELPIAGHFEAQKRTAKAESWRGGDVHLEDQYTQG